MTQLRYDHRYLCNVSNSFKDPEVFVRATCYARLGAYPIASVRQFFHVLAKNHKDGIGKSDVLLYLLIRSLACDHSLYFFVLGCHVCGSKCPVEEVQSLRVPCAMRNEYLGHKYLPIFSGTLGHCIALDRISRLMARCAHETGDSMRKFCPAGSPASLSPSREASASLPEALQGPPSAPCAPLF